MRKRIIKEKQIAAFARHLLHQEKSKNTIKLYVCALVQFVSWLQAGACNDRQTPSENSGGRWPCSGGQTSSENGSQPSPGNSEKQLAPGNSGSWWPWSRGVGGERSRLVRESSRRFWSRGAGGWRLWPASAGGKAVVTRELVLAYKDHLKAQYKPSSVNAKLAALNAFFTWQEWPDLKVGALKLQQRMFLDGNQLLEKPEYVALVTASLAQGNIRLALMMETMCCTGMRVSELQFVTVEAVRSGTCKIDCKGKIREVLLPDDLQEKLQDYVQKQGWKDRKDALLFATRTGRPIDPRSVWREMKGLCEKTGIAPEKVYPHNLRHLFARTYYEQTKDIVRLADLLGHSSVQTTRIYTRTSGVAEKETVNQLALAVNYSKAA